MQEVERLEGPIFVLGGGGFIGSNLVRYLRTERKDVHAPGHADAVDDMLRVKPKTVFNCAAYGTEAEQTNEFKMYEANFEFVKEALRALALDVKKFTFIQSGSSSEYGGALMGRSEEDTLHPRTVYGVTKVAAAMLVEYYGKTLGARVATLRLYSVYGRGDHEGTLISNLVKEGKQKRLPLFKNQATNRDFVFVTDACRAYVLAALNLKKEKYGEAFNIGGDIRTLREVAAYASKIFKIADEPVFDDAAPVQRGCSKTQKAEMCLGFKSEISLFEGLKKLAGGKNDRVI